jgi:hypothetical protein
MISKRRARTDREDLARWEEEGGTAARFNAEPKARKPDAGDPSGKGPHRTSTRARDPAQMKDTA